MNKPEITVNDKGITFETDAFRMNIEFNNAYVRKSRLVEKFEAFIQSINATDQPNDSAPAYPPSSGGAGGGANAKTGIKICAKCGAEFKPTGNAQRYCSPQCGMKQKRVKKRVKEDKSQDDLDKTLAEIEAARKKPYEFK